MVVARLVGQLVGWLVCQSFEHLCEKVIFRVSKGNKNLTKTDLPSYLLTYLCDSSDGSDSSDSSDSSDISDSSDSSDISVSSDSISENNDTFEQKDL